MRRKANIDWHFACSWRKGLSGLSPFLNKWSWSTEDVAHTWPSAQDGQTMYIHLVQTGVRKLGPTGAGKTFLACALGHAACQQDYIVRYFHLPRFFQTIHFAQIEDHYAPFLKSLSNTHLLILDDWLRDKPSLAETQTLLDILDDRYARMATMLVSQVPVPDWHPRFPDPTLADAILDRLLHNAYRIDLQGDSQRKLRAQPFFPST